LSRPDLVATRRYKCKRKTGRPTLLGQCLETADIIADRQTSTIWLKITFTVAHGQTSCGDIVKYLDKLCAL